MTQFCSFVQAGIAFGITQCRTFLGAIAFYTCLPISYTWSPEFSGIARWAPVIGWGIGILLGLLDLALSLLPMPILPRSVLIVASWVAITGGLHLDGAMDTADGLAVLDPQRRLDVMADSRTGAFGAMTAVIILVLKTASLASLSGDRGWSLVVAAGWGRWGQLVAITRYPYLKAEGKGAFHKAAIRASWEPFPMLMLMIGVSSIPLWFGWENQATVLISILGGSAIAFLTGAWFNQKLGGHTGDTYGAVVEWTEALLLCLLTIDFT
ncbi:MAG: adenosylcobinamide-GDP ribazoletransferase [Oscillatoriales cyanobacterium C42_A2020_001]|nr:adenosylcobinamide-GDP ribazoletransferase [Leptolyngbyaceae cyanobacterium C42_A2020_001]